MAACASAQTAATPAKTQTAAKPSTTAPKAATAAKPASQIVKPATTANKAAVNKPAMPATKPAQKASTKSTAAAAMKAPAKTMPQAPAAKPAAAKVAGRRDPFVSPLRLQEDKNRSNPVCTTGAKCLIISQVELKGIVKTPQGMIAMVENAAKKQYNLREKDPVMNGQVLRITGDSLIFRETVTDNLGNQTTREVVKKVTAPVI